MKKTLLITLCGSLLLTGCLTKELPSYNTYSLQLHTQPIKAEQKSNKSIFIAQPKALQSLKSKYIVYNKGLEQNRYALNLWSDEPTKMLQQLMSNYLDASKQYKYVSTSKLHETSDFTLYSELMAFNHDISTTPTKTKFAIRIYLRNNTTSHVLSKTFQYEETIEYNKASSAVEGLNKSMNQFMKELDYFITKSLSSS